MSATGPPPGDYRAPNGIFYRIVGPDTANTASEPLLRLHGLMVSGAMFDPLIALLAPDVRLIVPDLRGHGRSGDLAGPYDVAQLATDLDAVLADAAAPRCAVLGYSHGGAVAQQLAHTRPAAVARLMLVATYACNVATPRERIEAAVLAALLGVFTPGALARLIVQPSKPRPGGEVGPDAAQVRWLRALMAANRAAPMRAAARGLATFDARPWLAELTAPTLVVAGTHDTGVPIHHFNTLVAGIPGARGRLVERAGHMLAWTHTAELAEIVREEW
jgi:3-oxoadipate enol-lactonase